MSTLLPDPPSSFPAIAVAKPTPRTRKSAYNSLAYVSGDPTLWALRLLHPKEGQAETLHTGHDAQTCFLANLTAMGPPRPEHPAVRLANLPRPAMSTLQNFNVTTPQSPWAHACVMTPVCRSCS